MVRIDALSEKEDLMEVNVLQAKTDFSRLLHLLETKQEDSITISRYGKPVAKITAFTGNREPRKLGIYQNLGLRSHDLEEIDQDNEEIAETLMGGGL